MKFVLLAWIYRYEFCITKNWNRLITAKFISISLEMGIRNRHRNKSIQQRLYQSSHVYAVHITLFQWHIMVFHIYSIFRTFCVKQGNFTMTPENWNQIFKPFFSPHSRFYLIHHKTTEAYLGHARKIFSNTGSVIANTDPVITNTDLVITNMDPVIANTDLVITNTDPVITNTDPVIA